MPRTPKGQIMARKGQPPQYYPLDKAPPGSHYYFRICIDGHRTAISLQTTDYSTALRRRDAWLAGVRVTGEEAFLQSLVDIGQKAQHKLDRLLTGRGVRPPSGKD